jgi:hypothetical protein
MRQLLPLVLLFGCPAALAQPAPQHLCSSDNFKRLQTLDGAWEQRSPKVEQNRQMTDLMRVTAADCAVEQTLSIYSADSEHKFKSSPSHMARELIVLESSEPAANGRSVRHRFTISNLTAESLDWKHEISTDKGKSWNAAPQLRLARLRPDAKATAQAAPPGGDDCPTMLAWAPLPAAWVRYLLASSCH